MEQWQTYSDLPSTRHPRHPAGSSQMAAHAGSHPSQQHQQHAQTVGNREGNHSSHSGAAQNQAPAGFSYEAYQTPTTIATSPAVAQRDRMTDHHDSAETDVAMQDADPYNRTKYPLRPAHQRQISNQGSRPVSQYAPYEESSAARKYSPMDTLSPTSPYPASPHPPPRSSHAPYTPSNHSARQSPTRVTGLSFASQTYLPSPGPRNQAAPQLPPIQPTITSNDPYYPNSATMQLNAMFGRDMSHSSRDGLQRPDSSPRGSVPLFQKLRSLSDIEPRVNHQPPFRRANPEGGFISPLQALTTHLPATYRICNPNFKYESSRNPRRVLTKPSKGVKNDGYDNDDSDYILYVNDILGSEETGHKNRYLILDVLGQGTFGQVVKCQNLKTQEVVAVKVVKNRTAYFNQSMMEVSVLDLLNSKLDKNDDHHLLRLKDTFIHRQHLCLVFELLSVNLYELIKQNQFRGLSTTLVRVFAQQLLNALSLLNKARLIHCDLKPENILLKNLESPIIKIIDFGSACDERQTVYTYIQSRFYRSPEVLLGLPYSSAIDMWSLGCIVVELFLGLPLFPGSSEYNQVSRITEMLGNPPTWMLEMGKQAGEFFNRDHDEFNRRMYRLKSMEQYAREHNSKEQPSKKYFQQTTLPDIIRSYAMPRKNMKPAEIDREMNNRIAFIDFVRGLLNINPLERWSPQQAKLHPFITQAKFTGPFVPPMNLKAGSMTKSPAPGVQQQQQAEALSKQKAQAAQAAQAQAQSAAQSAYASVQMNQYSPNPLPQPQMYGNMYTPAGATNAHHQAAVPPPSYATASTAYGQAMGMMGPAPGATQMPPPGQYAVQQQPNLYAQAATRAGRQRASTVDHQQGGIPPAIQRVASHLDPNAPIRLQPSPAYYPPPQDAMPDATAGSARRRGSRAGQNTQGRNRDFIRNLEDRTLEEGFTQSQWH